MDMLLAAAALVLLHRIDGGEVLVAPQQVTSLHGRPTPSTKLITERAGCAIWLTDGKLIAVVEPCQRVQQLLEEARR